MALAIFTDPIVPNPGASTLQQRRRYIVECTRPYARWLALDALLDPPDQANRHEHIQVVLAFGVHCKCSADEILSIEAAEWGFATQYAENFLDALRRKVWPLCRARMPQETIQRAADEVMSDWNAWVPDELLNPVLRKIYLGAIPRKGRRHGR